MKLLPTRPSTLSHSAKRAQLAATFVTLHLVLRAVVIVFFLPLPPTPLSFFPVFLPLLFSRSKCLYFLQQTASRGTRVYFATCGDGSLPSRERAASCCWFLTCVHPFISMAARSSLLLSLLNDRQGSLVAQRPTSDHLMCSLSAFWGPFELSLKPWGEATSTEVAYLSAPAQCCAVGPSKRGFYCLVLPFGVLLLATVEM